jgi:predicted AlkP superfamily pyrophosphatase or phosphodiesterase
MAPWRTSLSLLALVACGSCDAAPPADGTPIPKVLVIGIDGVRPDVLAEVPTPSLDALVANGAFTDRARTVRPTVSGPAWSSLLLGVGPDKHGVVNNEFTGKRYGQYPDFLTRIETVRPELGTFAVADWKPLVSASDSLPTISDRIDVKHVLDGYEAGWDEGDAASVDLAVEHLSRAHPDAMFVYLGAPDEVSHQTGSIGEEYREAIARADARVGRLVEAVRARPTFDDEDWLVLVSTDHGRRAEGGHGGDTPEEQTIFYVASGPSASRGTLADTVRIVDVAVTALAHLGIDAEPAWQLDGSVRGLAR